MNPVTREQFEQFIITYPRLLKCNVTAICEPPIVTFNDFSLGTWPKSVVARHSFTDLSGKIPSDWEVKDVLCSP